MSTYWSSQKIDENKGVKQNTKGNGNDKDISKFGLIVKCYRCQDYGHTTANYLTFCKITNFDGILVES